MKTRSILFPLVVVSTFAVSSAQNCSISQYNVCLGGIRDFINNTNTMIVASVGMLFLAVSVVMFFLGVVRFIWAQQQGDQKGVDNGKELLKWGLIALFCIFSVYGIISFGQSIIFGSSDQSNIKIPRLIIDTTAPTPSGDGRVPVGPSGSQGGVPVGSSPNGRVPVGTSPATDGFNVGSILGPSVFGTPSSGSVLNGPAQNTTYDPSIFNTSGSFGAGTGDVNFNTGGFGTGIDTSIELTSAEINMRQDGDAFLGGSGNGSVQYGATARSLFPDEN